MHRRKQSKPRYRHTGPRRPYRKESARKGWWSALKDLFRRRPKESAASPQLPTDGSSVVSSGGLSDFTSPTSLAAVSQRFRNVDWTSLVKGQRAEHERELLEAAVGSAVVEPVRFPAPDSPTGGRPDAPDLSEKLEAPEAQEDLEVSDELAEADLADDDLPAAGRRDAGGPAAASAAGEGDLTGDGREPSERAAAGPLASPAVSAARRRAPFMVLLAVGAAAAVWLWLAGVGNPPPAPTPAPAPRPLPRLQPWEAITPLPFGPLAADRNWRASLVVDVHVVPAGGTLSQALESLSIGQSQRRALYDVLERDGVLGQVKPGEEFRAWWTSSARAEGDLERIEYSSAASPRPMIFMPGGPDGFFRFDLKARPRKIFQATQGVVSSSFWEAGEKAGLEPQVILGLVDLLASQIDFVSDIRTGDDFQLLFLGEYQEGRLIGPPVVEMIRMTNADVKHEFYRHQGAEGDDYYDAQFRSIRKNFFKSPLQYSRISSSFSRARLHPILKIVRPHLGVDYAAPAGTPVSAVADGTVKSAGFRGDYGRLVVLEHENDVSTMYGHLSVIAKGLKPGVKVKQGDLIGNVGASGLATGPHLDFRMKRKNVFVDPEETLAVQEGRPLPVDERDAFAQAVTRDQELMKKLLEGNM
ncbi:MAG: M23 family metallopeptidase [Deltaproteobacteria bacterium]|jgi:murein DD-endopeptidase MepM/ murein hydrolase activator NlpD|nr:M23 family metallopeptidase [Deltaproteobacteria bacterium]